MDELNVGSTSLSAEEEYAGNGADSMQKTARPEEAALGEIDRLFDDLDIDGALALGESALKSLQGDTSDLGQALRIRHMNKRAGLLLLLGKWSEAERLYNETITLAQKQKEMSEFIKARIGLGDLKRSRGEYREALSLFQNALMTAEAIESPEDQALAKYSLGALDARLGKHEEGRANLESAFALIKPRMQDFEYMPLVAGIYNQQGLLYFREGLLDVAASYYRKSLSLLEGRPNCQERAEAFRYIGIVNTLKSEYKEALRNHQEALKIYERTRNPLGEAKVYNSTGQSFLALTKLDEAVFFMEKAEKICIELGAEAESAALFGKLGQVYMLREDYSKAAGYYLKDLEMCQKFGNKRALAFTYRNLGQCYTFIGDSERAVGYLKESLKLFEEAQDELNAGRVFLDLCYVYINQGTIDEAEVAGSKALELLAEFSQTAEETAYAKTLFGVIQRHRKNWDLADSLFQESLATLKEREAYSKLAETWFEYGLLNLSRDDKEGALAKFKEALCIAKEHKMKKQTERYLKLIGRISEEEAAKAMLDS
jgi:tetratricopeptide (TPR) repeat protein